MSGEEINIAIVGFPGSGKTSLSEKYITGDCSNTSEPATYHVYTKEYSFGSDILNLIISDTGGTADQEPERDMIIKKADGFIIVYDITQTETFNVVKSTKDYLLQIGSNNKLPIIIVGTKSDLEDQRQISNSQLIDLAKEMDCTCFEVSAITGDNVDEVFTKLVSQIKETKKLEPKKEAKKGCCLLL